MGKSVQEYNKLYSHQASDPWCAINGETLTSVSDLSRRSDKYDVTLVVSDTSAYKHTPLSFVTLRIVKYGLSNLSEGRVPLCLRIVNILQHLGAIRFYHGYEARWRSQAVISLARFILY